MGRGPHSQWRTVVFAPVSFVSGIVDFVRNDLAKLLRFAAVSAVTVPLGLLLFWLLLQTNMGRVIANLLAVAISTIPNYLLNRRWVWSKGGTHSVRKEIAPFWALAFLGLVLSSIFVWIASAFTDVDVVLLGANFLAFGLLWLFKFFVIEKYLFGQTSSAAPA